MTSRSLNSLSAPGEGSGNSRRLTRFYSNSSDAGFSRSEGGARSSVLLDSFRGMFRPHSRHRPTAMFSTFNGRVHLYMTCRGHAFIERQRKFGEPLHSKPALGAKKNHLSPVRLNGGHQLPRDQSQLRLFQPTSYEVARQGRRLLL